MKKVNKYKYIHVYIINNKLCINTCDHNFQLSLSKLQSLDNKGLELGCKAIHILIY